jgi:hypothetical protein
MHYIIDHNVSFTLLRETSSEDSESPASCPPAGPPRSQFGGFSSSWPHKVAKFRHRINDRGGPRMHLYPYRAPQAPPMVPRVTRRSTRLPRDGSSTRPRSMAWHTKPPPSSSSKPALELVVTA